MAARENSESRAPGDPILLNQISFQQSFQHQNFPPLGETPPVLPLTMPQEEPSKRDFGVFEAAAVDTAEFDDLIFSLKTDTLPADLPNLSVGTFSNEQSYMTDASDTKHASIADTHF